MALGFKRATSARRYPIGLVAIRHLRRKTSWLLEATPVQTKEELMADILRLNAGATMEFLQSFSHAELKEYIVRLREVAGIPVHAWDVEPVAQEAQLAGVAG